MISAGSSGSLDELFVVVGLLMGLGAIGTLVAVISSLARKSAS